MSTNTDLCPNCGQPLGERPDFCESCCWMRSVTPEPYRPEGCIDGFPNVLIAAYVGANAPTYLRRFRRVSLGKWTLHIPAFLFTSLWYAYRKLYGCALLLELGALLLPALYALLLSTVGVTSPLAPTVLNYILIFIFMTISGLLANRVLFARVKSKIDWHRRQACSDGGRPDLETRLRGEDPTSVLSIIGFILLDSSIVRPLSYLLARLVLTLLG